jgi:aminopeptidase
LRGVANARLDAYAELAVAMGVNVQPNQELIVTAPVDAAHFVHRLASAAYARGATLVTALYDDPELLRIELIDTQSDATDQQKGWLTDGVSSRLRDNAAYLAVLGPRPDILAGIELPRIFRAHSARARADATQAAIIATMQTNASVVPLVTRTWAREVFPDQTPTIAERLLWTALFDGIGGTDAARYAETALRRLRTVNDRRARMQSHSFNALRLTGPSVRLTVGLAEGHIWRGGQSVSSRGVAFTPTLPMEAIFTATDPGRAEGTVTFSRAILLAGERVEGLEVCFRAGAAVRVIARSGQRAFEQLLDSDHGARRIGQIGLVDVTAPFARSAICYYNPILDAAAAPHLAFGASSPATLGRALGPQRANQSVLHIDAMFDAASLSVDGIDDGGTAHAVLRDGVFVL